MADWKPYTGDYDKVFYDLKLKTGQIVKECWPNAGHFHVCQDQDKFKAGQTIAGPRVESIRVTSGQ